jgi:hypothetical protein
MAKASENVVIGAESSELLISGQILNDIPESVKGYVDNFGIKESLIFYRYKGSEDRQDTFAQ